jgi:hypothetical protein
VPLCRKTKIVCTLGPACWSEEGLGALLDAGLNVARFNFSHGDHEGHAEVLERLRKVSATARGGFLVEEVCKCGSLGCIHRCNRIGVLPIVQTGAACSWHGS